MKAKQTQFLVLGLGRFGESVARNIFAMGRDVLAVDKDEAIVEDISPFVTQAIQADVTDEDTLKSIGAGNFDVAVVSTGDVHSSILISLMLREMGVKTVIAKAMDELHARVLKKVGVDRVVFPERETGLRIAKSLISPNIIELMELSNDYRIAELSLPRKWEGHSIRSLDVRRRHGLNILAVHRGGQFTISPSPDDMLYQGDGLLVLGRHGDIDGIGD